MAAYRILGLDGGEEFVEVRARFRALVKEVHPDLNDSTAETLAVLQRLLKAYEVLRVYAPREHEYEITPEEARKGGLRTIRVEDRELMLRIPVAVKNGTVLTPIGDPNWKIRVCVRDRMVDNDLSEGAGERKARAERARKFAETAARKEADESAGVLRGFVDKFVKASPASRLTRWAKRGA